MTSAEDNILGNFLKTRRARLDPATFGFSASRRRTPGLRREEVAQRADVSATWYTWLEQGRHGAPSADVLRRLADALKLTPPEREHLFLIAQRRPPEITDAYRSDITPSLQHVLDALRHTPALVKTSAWDIVAWNHAATKVLSNYDAMAPGERNILRLLFSDPEIRKQNIHWENQARLVVATFRLETARTGNSDAKRALVEEMSTVSPEFTEMWEKNDVSTYGDGIKHIDHPIVGLLALEFSTFAVDSQPDLSLLIYTPATPSDFDKIASLING